MRLRRAGGIVLLVPLTLFAVAAGCSDTLDTSTIAATIQAQPIIEIDPAAFLGDVLCADLPGAMHSYVATFFDYGPPILNPDGTPALDPDGALARKPAPGFGIALPSSEPTPCSQRVAFVNGVVGHRYVVEIDGYEQDTAAIAAACSQKPTYAQCLAEVTLAPTANGLCAKDDECTQGTCHGKCVAAALEVERADGCHPVKDGGDVHVCRYDGCAAPDQAKCAGQPKVKAPLGAGACTADADCFALGCYGQCRKEPLQHTVLGECKSAVGPSGQAQQAGVCIYTPVLGERHMVKVGTADLVKPRWTTSSLSPCGYDNQHAAEEYQRVELGPCPGALGETGPSQSPTGIRVIPSATLGDLTCEAKVDGVDGGTTGTVTTFDVEPVSPGQVAKKNIGCTSTEGALFEQGVIAEHAYVYTVKAHENGAAAATRQASCFATAQAGVIVLAKCDPLVPIAP